MKELITLPAVQRRTGLSGAAALKRRAPPARRPEEAASSSDPPFSDQLEKARKRKPPQEAGETVQGQAAAPLAAPQQPAGEAAPGQAVQAQGASPAPGEIVSGLLSQPGDAAPDGAQPQQPLAAVLPKDGDGPAPAIQPAGTADALPEDGDGQPPEIQPAVTAGAQVDAAQGSSASSQQPEAGGSQANAGQQAAHPQAPADSSRTEGLFDGARPAVQEPQPLKEQATSGESAGESAVGRQPQAGGQPEAAGSNLYGTGYDPQQAQIVENHPAEPARLAEARRPQLVDQVSKNLLELDKSGGSTLRLQLHPENLGKIDLQVSSGADGLRVLLTADLPATGALLERHLPDLRQALADAGVNLSGLNIDYGSSPGGSARQERWQPTFQPVPVPPAASLQEDAPLEFVPAGRAPSNSGHRVDFLV